MKKVVSGIIGGKVERDEDEPKSIPRAAGHPRMHLDSRTVRSARGVKD
jgi:hypothetical protein